MDRRDNTNQHGAKVPTEEKAIRHIEAEDMRQARKLYGQTYTEKDLQRGADQ